jgi:cell division protein FtsW (lipid II flippase)
MLARKIWNLVFLLAVVSICLLISGIAETQDSCELVKLDVYRQSGYVAVAAAGLMVLMVAYDIYNKLTFTNNLLMSIILIFLVPWVIMKNLPEKDCTVSTPPPVVPPVIPPPASVVPPAAP